MFDPGEILEVVHGLAVAVIQLLEPIDSLVADHDRMIPGGVDLAIGAAIRVNLFEAGAVQAERISEEGVNHVVRAQIEITRRFYRGEEIADARNA